MIANAKMIALGLDARNAPLVIVEEPAKESELALPI